MVFGDVCVGNLFIDVNGTTWFKLTSWSAEHRLFPWLVEFFDKSEEIDYIFDR